MNVAIYLRVDAPSQQLITSSVLDGCRRNSDTAWVFSEHDSVLQEKADCVVLFGIGGDAKHVYDLNRNAGKRTVLLDKPYIRAMRSQEAPRYAVLRVAVDGFQPNQYFQLTKRPSDRWDRLGVRTATYKERKGEAILFDGASNKYIAWNELGNGIGTGLEQWAEWGQRMVNEIRKHTDRPILYRPRPSHNAARQVEGAELSEGRLEDDFWRSALVVSHGGNIGFDAVVRGIPHFAIGDSVARPLSETDWTKIGTPYAPTESDRRQWLCDLAYCQWTLEEFSQGIAWRYIRETFEQIDSLRRTH